MYKKVLKKLRDKKLLVVAILLFFAINIIIITTFTEKTTSTIWDGKIADGFTKGSGSLEDPYIINNGGELAYFMQIINSDESGDYFNKYYSLNNNINLNGFDFSFAALNKKFSGNFNGNGYKIFNFKISNYYYDEENKEANYTLFDTLDGADFINLNISDVTFEIDNDLITKETEEIKEKDDIKESDENKEEITDEEKEEPKEETKEEEVKKTSSNKKFGLIKVESKEETSNEENTEVKEEPKEEITEENKTEEVIKPDENKEEIKDDEIIKPDENKEEITDEEKEEPKEETKEDNLDDLSGDNKIEEDTIEEIVKDDVRHINVALFKNAEDTDFGNINIYNISIETKIESEYITSSLFLINDIESNGIYNINLNGNSTLSNTSGLINNYNSADIHLVLYDIEDLEIINNYKEKNDTLIKYTVTKKGIEFDNTDIEKVLKSLNEDSELEWVFEDNQFRIVNLGVNEVVKPKAIKGGLLKRAAISEHASGVDGNTVYINDLTSDYNYYQGLNFTEVRSTSIPSGTSTGYYDSENLVKVELIYDGANINDSSIVGAMSPVSGEGINKFVYFKYYALERNSNGTLATNANGDNYIKVELIDNPFTKRPYVNNVEYAFNGWICNQGADSSTGLCDNAKMYFDNDDYTRYMEVGVGAGREVVIHLNASWTHADVITNYNDIDDFDSMSMKSIVNTYYVNENRNGNAFWKQNYATMVFYRTYVRNDGYMPYGYWYKESQTGTTYTYIRGTRTRCGNNRTCYVYSSNPTGITGGSQYTGGSVEFVPSYYNNRNNTSVTVTTFNPTYMNFVVDPDGMFNEAVDVPYYTYTITNGQNASGFYYRVSNPTTAMINTREYYNSSGTLCTSASSCTTAYKLIQYNDSVTKTNGNSISIMEEDNAGSLVDADRYFYLVTRDTNIFRYTSSTSLSAGNIAVNRPFTVTGVSVNGSNITGVISNTGSLTVQNDLVIENIKIYGPDKDLTIVSWWTGEPQYENLDLGDDSKYYGVIYANSKNLKIGRNVTPSRGSSYLMAESVFGGTNNAGPSGTSRVIIESGIYYAYHSGAMSGNSSYTMNETTILGSDYDRVTNTNNKLRFLIGLDGYAGGHHTAGSDSLFASFTIVKSGMFGYNYSGTPSTDSTSGLYIGGRASTCVESVTGAKIEGGQINIITGGYGYNGSTTTNSTYIGMSGGTVRSIYGGAGHSTTKGNRIINVSGGTVTYSVLGGSDSFSSDDNNDGVVQGSTLVYVGGSTTVGGANDTLQGVESGSVFGAGGGNSNPDATAKGTVYNSHVIINGGTINTSVYGGGNYGSTGTQYSGNSTAKIDILNGTIGTVYGGSKSAGFGRSQNATSNVIDINISGGTIGEVYGGSNTSGTCNGSVDMDITGGTITGDVYGGGKGNATIVTHNVSVTVGDTTSGPSIAGNVYGGSAYGTVNATSANAGYSNGKTVNVTVNKGNITGSVFGGAKGGSGNDQTPYVSGDITVQINGGTITSVFGGCDEAGKPAGSATVYIDGGTVGNAYGGGNKTSIDTTNIYLRNNGEVLQNIYGGSNQSGTVVNSYVTVSGGECLNVYGGNNAGGTCTTTHVNVSGGTISSTVYGGGNEAVSSTTNVDIAGGSMSTVYGGGNLAEVTGNTNVTVNAGTITSVVYGGGNEGEVGGNTTVNITGSTAAIPNVYGGGNQADVVGITNVTVSGGTISNTVYGGGNLGEVDHDTYVTINGSSTNVSTVYGGGNKAKVAGNTNVSVTGGTISTIVYGGGNEGKVDHNTTVTINGSSVTVPIVYGGGNKAEVSGNTTVTVTSGTISTAVLGGGNEGEVGGNTTVIVDGATASMPTVYGGGNKAEVTGNTTVNISNGAITNAVYGGGNEGTVGGSTNVNVSGSSNIIPSVFGGGNKAGANTTNVTFTSNGRATDVYGGSNQQGTVTESNVNINNGTITNVYGGNNAGGTTTETNVTLTNGAVTTIYGGGNEAVATDTNVTVNGGTVITVYGGGNKAAVSNSTNVEINGSSNIITSIYGGGNQAGVATTNVTLNSGTQALNVFGGSNQQGTVTESNVTANNGSITNIFGGNNAGGNTVTANVNVNGGTTTNVYGGGNEAVTGDTVVLVDDGTVNNLYGGGNRAICSSTEVTMTGGTVNYLYGGGNAAGVTNGTTVTMLGGVANNNIYGGGNQGTVGTNTSVLIHNAVVRGSAYAGGNGSTATVFGNTEITVSGTSIIGSTTCSVLSQCSVFGGGNAATTGSELTNNSTAKVNIKGATVYGNVYGGANTSKVFGETTVKIGNNVPTQTNVVKGDILIKGTVFGGGEANASGSDEYDWNFVSVTKGIDVIIDGDTYENFTILGSIFGSGNASTTTGTSEIVIKNYGTYSNPKSNISIQRTDLLTIDNSSILLIGATDRENEYSDVLFTLSRIGELDLKNNSTLYLETGANLLQEFKSLTSDGSVAEVTINENNGTITKNVDNRIYMYIDKNLNIAKNQNITDYGEVTGMTFFGMYKYNANGTINTGIYDKHDYGDDLDWGSVFDNVSSYVLGLHKTNHDIEADGFYTNYIDEATATNKPNYITPTPPTGPLYMWTIGEGVIEYEIDLSASKYSTLGTTELSLRDFTDPNTSFQILGFDYSDLDSEIELVEKNNIKKIADTDEEANTIMGISMETSNIGWLVNGNTQFLTDEDNPFTGTVEYIGGNNASAPTLLFYFHHSKNISETGDLGSVKIQLLSIRQIDALNKETKRLIITINLTRVLIDTVNYEGAMTAGRKYDLFTSTATNITSSSSISAYYSLFNAGSSIYRTGYHRALMSNYVLPLNTKITMIDLAQDTPEYYYHIINSADVTYAQNQLNLHSEIPYNLSLFEVMGALNSGVYYDDVQKNIDYCSTGNYCNEEFIFIIDFGDTNINADALANSLLIEIRDEDEESIYSVLGPQHGNLIYNIYTNKDAIIDMEGEISTNKIYNGESLTADLTIDYTQSMVGSTVIYDTHYFDSKLGIKISLINEDDEVVTGTTLLGLYYEIDGVRYYPNIDGSARIKIADKVDSAEKWVIVNTGTSTIASGNYTLRFESFGSPDGIYYGLESSDTKDFEIEIVNEIYGLDIHTTAEEMIIDALTGNNANGEPTITYNIEYNSGLTNPSIRFKMYRRNYESIDDTTYSLINAQDYFDNSLNTTSNQYEYRLISNPNETTEITLNLNSELVTGTYKMQFILYDDNSPIGTVDKYIIIK